MTQALWDEVDEFIERTLLAREPALEAAAAASEAAGLPQIALSPAQGRLLRLLVEIHEPRLILELGTLGGYSTICLAGALGPGGRVISLEVNPAYAEVAVKNIAAAGLADRAEVRVGPALEGLARIAEEGIGPFDLVFIDADKETTPEYFEWALRLSRPGSVILTDNVVRDGELVHPGADDPGAQGMHRFHELLAGEPRVEATTIQTVGIKGYDGFTLARVKG
jgi:predicted O-methyltransferase YrrM